MIGRPLQRLDGGGVIEVEGCRLRHVANGTLRSDATRDLAQRVGQGGGVYSTEVDEDDVEEIRDEVERQRKIPARRADFEGDGDSFRLRHAFVQVDRLLAGDEFAVAIEWERPEAELNAYLQSFARKLRKDLGKYQAEIDITKNVPRMKAPIHTWSSRWTVEGLKTRAQKSTISARRMPRSSRSRCSVN